MTNVLLSSVRNTKNVLFFIIFAFQDLQTSVPCLLTSISFLYIKFANIYYLCSQIHTNLVSLWTNLRDRIFKIKQYLIINQNILQSLSKYMRQALVLLKRSNYGKRSISIFKEFFACIDKILILERRLSTRL